MSVLDYHKRRDKDRIAELEDEVRDLTVELTRERRAKQAQPAKPKVHSRKLRFTSDGGIYREHEIVTAVTVGTICWTDDGRLWIDSGRNRELATRLRSELGLDREAAADALDGGEQ